MNLKLFSTSELTLEFIATRVMLVLGLILMYSAASKWANAEWAILDLKGTFAVDFLIVRNAVSALVLYWVAFFFIITSTTLTVGPKAAFIVWALMGIFFEILTFGIVIGRNVILHSADPSIFFRGKPLAVLIGINICFIIAGFLVEWYYGWLKLNELI